MFSSVLKSVEETYSVAKTYEHSKYFDLDIGGMSQLKEMKMRRAYIMGYEQLHDINDLMKSPWFKKPTKSVFNVDTNTWEAPSDLRMCSEGQWYLWGGCYQGLEKHLEVQLSRSRSQGLPVANYNRQLCYLKLCQHVVAKGSAMGESWEDRYAWVIAINSMVFSSSFDREQTLEKDVIRCAYDAVVYPREFTSRHTSVLASFKTLLGSKEETPKGTKPVVKSDAHQDVDGKRKGADGKLLYCNYCLAPKHRGYHSTAQHATQGLPVTRPCGDCHHVHARSGPLAADCTEAGCPCKKKVPGVPRT